MVIGLNSYGDPLPFPRLLCAWCGCVSQSGQVEGPMGASGKVFLSEKQVIGFWATQNIFTNSLLI